MSTYCVFFFFFFQAEDGIRDVAVTGVQTCALPILSRDIRELGLAKVAAPDGGSHYAPPPEAGAAIRPHLAQLLPAVLVSVDGVGPLLVVKTPAGGAQGLGLAIDAAGWTEIIGTIAGDDAVLVITKSERARRAVQTRIKELAGIPD